MPNITNRFKLRIPIFFIIGVILIVAALIVGGQNLAISTAWRYLAGLVTGIIAMIVFSGVKKARAKRK